ncbi:protein of unknown function (plasmid) [Azospirillum baldaniorum]|uniref:Uncharacterized protein n=1 Tax=Azospirillum baldaniorum TaxID=1064539 RepID=A0A9P1JYK4_9PROT|nr:protein of unknown function [Azospirillum baldaniorum]
MPLDLLHFPALVRAVGHDTVVVVVLNGGRCRRRLLDGGIHHETTAATADDSAADEVWVEIGQGSGPQDETGVGNLRLLQEDSGNEVGDHVGLAPDNRLPGDPGVGLCSVDAELQHLGRRLPICVLPHRGDGCQM